jgi:Cytochrome P460
VPVGRKPRLPIAILAVAGGVVVASLLPEIPRVVRRGWGSEYPDTLRNGEWEYRTFTADKKPNENVKLTACFECHKPLASQDFVHAYDKLKVSAR